jgi:hypothetical protein
VFSLNREIRLIPIGVLAIDDVKIVEAEAKKHDLGQKEDYSGKIFSLSAPGSPRRRFNC